MENSKRESFIFDTSAFISLESVSLLDIVLKNFHITTSPSVIRELENFAIHNDQLGEIAQRVLKKKTMILSEAPMQLQPLSYVSDTDKDLFNLALSRKIALVTDDVKLVRHSIGTISTEFSPFFLTVFTEAGLFQKNEAIQKLETMRSIRNWRNNTIYLSAIRELTLGKDNNI